MANGNEIEIVVTADNRSDPGLKSAASGVQTFERTVSGSSDKVKRSNADVADSFDKVGERADDVDTKAMGFRDTMTGVQDTMAGTAMIAKGDLFNGFLTLGMGIGDLASGMFNFLVPTIKKAVIAMRALNLTMLANPIGLVIAAIAALVAAFVILYKKNETFRHAVDAMGRGARKAFSWVLDAARAAVGWIQRRWPLLLAILTGPIGLAVLAIRKHFGRIRSVVSSVVSAIRRGFASLKSAITNPIRDAVNSVKSWLSGLVDFAAGIPGKIVGKIKGVVPGFAHGGIIGAASGGPRSGMTLVGEHGPELVKLPAGSSVISNPDTRRRLSPRELRLGKFGLPRDAFDPEEGRWARRGARYLPRPRSEYGGGRKIPRGSAPMEPGAKGAEGGVGSASGEFVIQIKIGDRDLGEMIVDPLRRAVRKRGGNVQVVLGTGPG